MLVEVMKQWIDDETLSMVRAMLGPMRIKTKRDPMDYVATLISGLPQGPPSSPILLNMFIDALATTADASDCVRSGKGAVVVMADDVLIQASSQENLQTILNIAEEWQTARGEKWSLAKCV